MRRGSLDDNPGDDATVVGDHLDGLITLFDLGVRIDNRLQDVGQPAAAAEAREVRANFATAVAARVAYSNTDGDLARLLNQHGLGQSHGTAAVVLLKAPLIPLGLCLDLVDR